jgi:hypothetical protein
MSEERGHRGLVFYECCVIVYVIRGIRHTRKHQARRTDIIGGNQGRDDTPCITGGSEACATDGVMPAFAPGRPLPWRG